MPAIVKAPFVEALSRTSEVALTQRRHLLASWQARGDYGLRRVQSTVEGTPASLWLITTGGALTLITDYTRDSYSTRAVDVATPKSLDLASPARDEQHPLRPWFPSREETYLR